MRQTETILLLEGGSGLPFAATLIREATAPELHAADALWSPFLAQSVADALARGVPRYALPENKHWDWGRKARAMGAESVAFAIEAGGEAQALMIVRTDKTCRLPQTFGQSLLYIDCLSAAPWNLPRLTPTPRYRSCGRKIVQAAIRYSQSRYSQSLGHAGRIGLHSLQGAEAFYRDRLKMHDLGIDRSYESLRYFEMTETVAA